MKLLTNESALLANIWNIAKNAETLTLFLHFTYQMFKCRNIVKFLKVVDEIDENVRNVPLTTFEIKSFKILSADENVQHLNRP